MLKGGGSHEQRFAFNKFWYPGPSHLSQSFFARRSHDEVNYKYARSHDIFDGGVIRYRVIIDPVSFIEHEDLPKDSLSHVSSDLIPEAQLVAEANEM